MPELPERGREEPPAHMKLREHVEAACSETEYRIARAEEWVERLRVETGEDWVQNYLPLDVEVDLELVGIWPNGEPMMTGAAFTNPAAE